MDLKPVSKEVDLFVPNSTPGGPGQIDEDIEVLNIALSEPVTEPDLAEGIQKIFKFSWLIHAHIAGIQEASSLSDDEHLWEMSSSEEEEEDDEHTPIHRERLNEIVGIIGQPPLSPHELAQFLVNPPKQSHHESEQHGFFRLVRGYTAAKRTQDWMQKSSGRNSSPIMPGSKTTQTDGTTSRQRTGPPLWQHRRVADPISLFRQTVHNSVQSLCFAIEWKEMSTVQGGKAWKTKYRTEAFRRQNPQFFATM
ncbi:hypothetical protein GALMADRAFT_279176 [Galerina marginata CBS 339.88]|uniref:Uncharacterized protein n=1 Tax=Galerina marginata (strain CBS 339.88) TaxID=685588 RepID=A0A067TC21_GALM3|nr:hypothetical protein GALMADRAFT_279176 [Galerina marginata CBS 339.88]